MNEKDFAMVQAITVSPTNIHVTISAGSKDAIMAAMFALVQAAAKKFEVTTVEFILMLSIENLTAHISETEAK